MKHPKGWRWIKRMSELVQDGDKYWASYEGKWKPIPVRNSYLVADNFGIRRIAPKKRKPKQKGISK